MADDSFVDSPWVQLGVPLAATLATAIAPRHAGRVSQLGLDAFQGINQYRYGQKRLSQLGLKAQEQADAEKEQDDTWEGLRKASTHVPQSDTSPDGGSAPQAVDAGHDETLNAGVMPKIHGPDSTLTPEEIAIGDQIGHVAGKGARAKYASEILTKKAEDSGNPTLQEFQGLDQNKIPEGQTLTGHIRGSNMQFTAKRPEAPKPQTAEQAASSMESSSGLRDEALGVLGSLETAKDRGVVEKADSGRLVRVKGNEYSPINPAGAPQRLGAVAQAAQAGPTPPQVGQRLSGPAPQAVPQVAPRQTIAPRVQGGETFGLKEKEVSPEKQVDRDAVAAWRNDPAHKNASPQEVSQAMHLMSQGILTTDLDPIADMIAKGDPHGLVAANTAFGRGSNVRAYVYGRAARTAAAEGKQFNPAENDRKIKVMAQFADQSRGPGRSLVALGTAARHIDGARNAIMELNDTGAPVLNMPLNKFLRDYAGSKAVSEVQTALSVVPYEYMTMLKNGMALTDKDTQEADKLVNLGMTTGQFLGTFEQMSHIMVARGQEMNHAFKTQVGIDIPEAISPEAAGVLQSLGDGSITGGGKGKQSQGQPTPVSKSGRPMKKDPNSPSGYSYAD